RDVAVLAVALVPHEAEQVAGVLDVFDGEPQEDLLRVLLLGEYLAELLVVGAALGDRRLEDRRVRRDADDGVVADQLRQLALAQQTAREVIDPHALAELGQLLQTASHRFVPLPSPRSSQVSARIALRRRTVRRETCARAR